MNSCIGWRAGAWGGTSISRRRPPPGGASVERVTSGQRPVPHARAGTHTRHGQGSAGAGGSRPQGDQFKSFRRKRQVGICQNGCEPPLGTKIGVVQLGRAATPRVRGSGAPTRTRRSGRRANSASQNRGPATGASVGDRPNSARRDRGSFEPRLPFETEDHVQGDATDGTRGEEELQKLQLRLVRRVV